MSLQLIFGASGSGKSDYVYKRILEQSQKEENTTFFVLVPEQFTMQTQRELVKRQKHHSIMNVDVVSFHRLAYRIFDELGMGNLKVLEETGKNLVLRRVAEEQQDNLQLIKGSMKKAGYISEVKSVISELTQYRIEPEQLDTFIQDEKESPLFRYKIQDIQTMYQGFLDYLQKGNSITAEELLEVLAQVADQSEILRNSVIVLDGFTGFTPVQYYLLEKLMKLTEEILVTVTLDERENPYKCSGVQELFYMSKKTVETLLKVAEHTHTEVKEPYWTKHSAESRFGRSEQLLWLEQNLFRAKPQAYRRKKSLENDTGWKNAADSVTAAPEYAQEKSKNGQEISLYSLPSPRQELHFIAKEIKRLVREEQYRYLDIAIVCGDVEMYGNYAKEIFDTYEIPLFLDTKRNIVFHPMTEFLKRALLMIEQDFSYETVLGYLRCGLSGFIREDVDLLENYLLAEGIRGYRRWQEKWVRRGIVQSQEELDRINEVRESLTAQFLPLWEVFRKTGRQETEENSLKYSENSENSENSGNTENAQEKNAQKKRQYATVLEESRALYQLIFQLNIEEQLKEYETYFQEEGETSLAKEYAQIYKIVMDLLDKMVELLQDERLNVREYREILEAGLEAAAVGIIPPGYDRVVFGDIERTRLSDIKVLFFAGVNDGLIPKATEHGGIISQPDRECFAAHGMELAPTDRERSFIQKFYLYLNLTKPSEKLYMTCFRVSQDGREARKSYLIGTILKMFPGLSMQKIENTSEIVTPESSVGFFVEGLKKAQRGNITSDWKALYHWYMDDEHPDKAKSIEQTEDAGESADSQKIENYSRNTGKWFSRVTPFLEAAFYQYRKQPMGREVTRALYGTVLENSVTRLEQFSTCAFRHFLQYGLKLEERNLGEFAPVDMGNMFHEALERYARALEKEGYLWSEVPKEVQEHLIEQAVEETLEAGFESRLLQEARTTYLVERIKRILKRTVETIAEQIKTSHFTPEGYEISFSFAENLEAVNFSLNEEEKMRLQGRIDRIDTRKTEDKVYVKVIDYKSGNRDFQLLSLYHGLQLQLVVYMNSAVELLKRKYPDKEVIPGGMYYYHLDDPVIEGNSTQTDAEIREKILEALKLKGVAAEEADDSVSKKAQRAGKNEFQILSRFVNHKIQDIGHRIFEGEIAPEPYLLGDNTGCDYCPYHGVCGFDATVPGQEYRKLENIKEQEIILARMQKEIETVKQEKPGKTETEGGLKADVPEEAKRPGRHETGKVPKNTERMEEQGTRKKPENTEVREADKHGNDMD